MSSDLPVVSFLVAAHQAGDCLPGLVRKILDQAGEGRYFELVISPDCPLDYRALLPVDDRIVFAPAGLRSGPSAARTRALRVASGSHVCLLDADDDIGDGFMPAVEAALQCYEAFCLRTAYQMGGRTFKRYEGAEVDYQSYMDYYGSIQPVVPKSWLPLYPEYVAEDAIVMVSALYRAGGRLPVIDAVYIARLSDESYCSRNSSLFTKMYQDAIANMPAIALSMGVPGALLRLIEAFYVRAAMSQSFDRYVESGGHCGYHDFVLVAQQCGLSGRQRAEARQGVAEHGAAVRLQASQE